MGRQVFTAGEILTAASMNDLGDATVMVFDDATDRATAIPTPVEGMVTYLEDVGGAQGLEVFDGAVFTPVAIVPDPPGLIAVKSAQKTDTFSVSLSGGGNAAVTDLSITHEVADPANRLIITAFFGVTSNSLSGRRSVGIAVSNGSGLLTIGDAEGSRNRVTASYRHEEDAGGYGSLSMTIVHTPGAGSFTYDAHVILMDGGTATVFVNRNNQNTDAAFTPRGASGLQIMEVSV